MNLFRRLASIFSGGAPRADKRYLTIYALSRRCNEPVIGQVDVLNELSKPDEGDYAYYTRKVLHTTGEKRCFAQVEVQLYFNQDKQVVHYEVEGGRWLTSEEYGAELARFNAPPEEEEPEAEKTEAADAELEGASPTAESLSKESPSNATTNPVAPTSE